VPAALASGDEALGIYREQGFLTVRGLLAADEVRAVRAELEGMALSDDPGCGSVWYEGAVRDHVRLDESRDHHVDGRTTGLGFAPGQEGAVPDLDPAVRARYVRKFMGFVDRQPALTALASHPAVLAVVTRLLGDTGTPEMFQDMALVKPGGGREKPWHQDHAYFNVALDTRSWGCGSRWARSRPRTAACTCWPAATRRGRGRTSSGATGRFATRTWTPSAAWPCRW
jgi:hypothetical protein